MDWLLVVIASILTLFAAFGVVIWIWTTTLYLFLSFQKKLTASRIASQPLFALTVTAYVFMALLIAPGAYAEVAPHDPALPAHVLTGWSVVAGICLVLWLCTVYLKLSPKIPTYRYLLPQQADIVRFEECKQGIVIAAKHFPHTLDQETARLLAWITAISFRQEHYPKSKKEAQLTNDFAVYTSLCIEGFTQGYESFNRACQEAPDQLASLRQVLQDWPEHWDIDEELGQLAMKYLGLDEQR